MHKIILLTATILGAFSVMLGAFGAHALRSFLEASNRIDTFETAVKYQFYHTLLLLAIGILKFHVNNKFIDYAAISTFLGIIIFSGSLYILCFSGITKWGAVTPIGGLLLIIGWILLAVSLAKEF